MTRVRCKTVLLAIQVCLFELLRHWHTIRSQRNTSFPFFYDVEWILTDNKKYIFLLRHLTLIQYLETKASRKTRRVCENSKCLSSEIERVGNSLSRCSTYKQIFHIFIILKIIWGCSKGKCRCVVTAMCSLSYPLMYFWSLACRNVIYAVNAIDWETGISWQGIQLFFFQFTVKSGLPKNTYVPQAKVDQDLLKSNLWQSLKSFVQSSGSHILRIKYYCVE